MKRTPVVILLTVFVIGLLVWAVWRIIPSVVSIMASSGGILLVIFVLGMAVVAVFAVVRLMRRK